MSEEVDQTNRRPNTNIFHHFRADYFVGVFLRLKPQAESLGPFGTKSLALT